ncbi:alpha/beta fold hydrolase [Swaminathania salitolerans]|uniref:Alpha/beta hydrolase n=1 Tax=Swaminathania salitolerans TaxID=182838 RepID=A0A511BX57_9PROT|nr:alpha/beta hydrolase [Swaminathania salitolerans]GBQ11686.1 biotin synthase [Swaminathania salitolerans LMG 21291]GEL02588.1 alpha/beta hydrolase [Swaminathania salitolerans]
MKTVFLHGWSYDSGVWASVREALPDPDGAVFLDLGHTDLAHTDPSQTNPSHMDAPCPDRIPDEPFLAVGHSAGALWFLNRAAPQCRGVVAINGFSRFCKAPDFENGIEPRLVERMIRQLDSDPAATVRRFRKSIMCPLFPLPEPAPDALRAGLQGLLEHDGRPAARSLGRRLVSVEGEEDPLLCAAMRDEAFPEADRRILPGGHLLPLTDPESCARIIRDTLDRVS